MDNNKKWFIIIGVVIACAVIGGVYNAINPKKDDKPTTTTTTAPKEDVMEYVKKCAVMEAADLYTDKTRTSTENVFDAGRKTCEKLRTQIGDDEEFIKTVKADWERRKEEQIDGKPLSHYLTVLNW